MPSRKLLIQFHLMIASLFLPLMLMLPATGALYIWGVKGTDQQAEAFRTTGVIPADTETQEAFFREKFKEAGVDYDFEYIRVRGADYTFRPQSKVYFTAKAEGENLTFTRHDPALLTRLTELHKGHGPVMMRWFESAFGVALILTTISGLWLAVTVKAYRSTTLISFAIGSAIMLFCLI